METVSQVILKIPIEKNIHMPVTCDANITAVDTFLDIGELISEGVMSVQAWGENILYKMCYTNSLNFLEPILLTQDGEKIEIALGNLGKHKNTHWEFQNEWRYIMVFLPIGLETMLSDERQQIFLQQLINGELAMRKRFHDLKIADGPFSQMEIMASPKMSAGYRILLQDLIEKYNPSASFKESELINLREPLNTRQERTARIFSFPQSLESGGILDVFPTFQTEAGAEKGRCSAADEFLEATLI